MSHIDRIEDRAIQARIDELLDTAQESANIFSTYTTEQVQKIVLAMSEAGQEKAAFYAEWSVRETGRGNVDDNVVKNLSCSTGLLERYRPADFVEPVIDDEKKIIAFPKPAGIIAALIPSTNPVMTVYYKAMVSMMTRNAIIFSPHPAMVARYATALPVCRVSVNTRGVEGSSGVCFHEPDPWSGDWDGFFWRRFGG
uniref:Aldehyde dehydrogenase family protein n=1 Tax=Candidatus Kentrum sp. LFY TaxID=2126342 RepID=A0A450WQC2_9GAMM|nr:MAG: Aldehyde dehydrogenase family protein [Candidatus Kentron sp. LFY]